MLAELPELPVKDPASSRSVFVLFPGADANAVAVALSSPLTALVPRGFKASSAGRHRRVPSHGEAELAREFVLERNLNAARGPAFLARVEVTLVGGIPAGGLARMA